MIAIIDTDRTKEKEKDIIAHWKFYSRRNFALILIKLLFCAFLSS